MNNCPLGFGLIFALISINAWTAACNFIGPDWLVLLAILSGLYAVVSFIHHALQ